MKKLLILLPLCLLLTSCDGTQSSLRIIQEQGYSEVQITGVNIFACSKDDIFRYNFVANSPNGTNVRGVVCSAPLKGYTVRFFPNK